MALGVLAQGLHDLHRNRYEVYLGLCVGHAMALQVLKEQAAEFALEEGLTLFIDGPLLDHALVNAVVLACSLRTREREITKYTVIYGDFQIGRAHV